MQPVILLINGPNLGMLGKRDPAQYGSFTLADVEKAFSERAGELGVEARFFQSDCEGEICRAIHGAMSYAAGIVINAGAYTHYSYAIFDALLMTKLPVMEVHISDIHAREAFRNLSVIQPACVGQICGLGLRSYTAGLETLVEKHIRGGNAGGNPDVLDAKEKLGKLRAEITRTDAQMIALLRHRMDLASEVIENKAKFGKEVYDAAREAVVIANAKNLATAPYAPAAATLMNTLMRLSRERQYDDLLKTRAEAFYEDAGLPRQASGSLEHVKRVAFGGSSGSFSAQAAKTLFPGQELIPCESFSAACECVRTGKTDVAVLPLANTTGGAVGTVYRLLSHRLHIVRSLDLPVRHCLAAPEGATLSSIRCVCSHPQALAQCSQAIHEHAWNTENFENTAFAAAAIAREQDPARAALCSLEAARANHLCVLKENICDTDCNATRFIVAARELILTPDASRLGLLFEVSHRSGALAAVLNAFNDRALNLSSIYSLPVPERPWEFAFFADINAPALDRDAIAAVYQLSRELPGLRVVGWYGTETPG